MAATGVKCLRPIVGISNFLSTKCSKVFFPTFYSVFAPDFKNPCMNREKIKDLIKTKSRDELLGIRVKPATNQVFCSAFYNEEVELLINIITKDGKREVAKNVVRDAFTKIKHIQLRKYNNEVDENKKEEILINPLEVFLLAVKNVTPLMWYLKIRKSGSWFKVPIGITERKGRRFALKWLLESSKEKGKKTKLSDQMAEELIAAAQYEGKSIAKKLELHKLCEANRGYLHYWWT